MLSQVLYILTWNDFCLVYFRGKLLFGYSDHELQEKGGYDLIHPDDLTYYAAAHQECESNLF